MTTHFYRNMIQYTHGTRNSELTTWSRYLFHERVDTQLINLYIFNYLISTLHDFKMKKGKASLDHERHVFYPYNTCGMFLSIGDKCN